MVILSLSPLKARKSDNYRYCDSWKSDIYRRRNKGKKLGRLRAITLLGAIKKKYSYRKIEKKIRLIHILGAPIIFRRCDCRSIERERERGERRAE